MISNFISILILIVETTYDILLPIWIFLFVGAGISVVLERINLSRFSSSNVALGSLIGIISPLPTVSIIKVLKPCRYSVALIYSSLLANPILIILIYINIGFKAALFYFFLVWLIGAATGLFLKYSRDDIVTEDNPVQSKTLLSRFWGHLCFSGYYTAVGALIAALLRVFVSYTKYNNHFFQHTGSSGLLNLVFVLLSVPTYSCGGTWLPVLKELGGLGVGFSGLISFILLGQATRLGHLMALKNFFSKKNILLWVLYIAMLAMLLTFSLGDIIHDLIKSSYLNTNAF